MEHFQRVEADRRHDEREVSVDLIRREGRRGRVAGDVDVVDLGDGGVQFGDVAGHAYLAGDGAAPACGDEDDGGAEGKLDAEIQIFGRGREWCGGECRLITDVVRPFDDVHFEWKMLTIQLISTHSDFPAEAAAQIQTGPVSINFCYSFYSLV